MQRLLEWFVEQKGWVMFGTAVAVYLITLVLWFGFDLFWPWGFAVGTVLAVVGMISGK
jgi:hypothetical protein